MVEIDKIPAFERRYDIDWLRIIAIGLLLIYHIGIIFQPWGIYYGFIQSSVTSSTLFIPMSMINIWRIPLLFFVSGMGVCFSLRRRNWKQLLIERSQRILLPLIFGVLFIVPLHVYLFQIYYDQEIVYSPNLGHLWFLANISIYVVQIIGFAFFDKEYNYRYFNFLRNLLEQPYYIYIFIIPFVIEAVIINPDYFSLYVGSGHGFVLGMLAFFSGFLFVAIGDKFWSAVTVTRNKSLIAAMVLFFIRYFYFELNAPNYLSAVESLCWIFTIFGYGLKYLNKSSKLLNYLSQAAYPVYIIHMFFLYLGATLIFPLDLHITFDIIFLVIFTFSSCYIFYEFIIRRISVIRPLFGLKIPKSQIISLE